MRRAREAMAALGCTHEILIVDDGSTDGTGALADRLARECPQVRVVHHAANLGFTGAILSSYRNGAGEWLFLCPADGQVDVADVRLFLERRAGVDVVIGHRLAKPEPWHRRMNSKAFHLMTSALFGFRFREISTCKLYKVDWLRRLRIISKPGTATIEPEVIFRLKRLGARFAEVGYPWHARQGGTPKGARLGMIVRTFFELFRLRWKLAGSESRISNLESRNSL